MRLRVKRAILIALAGLFGGTAPAIVFADGAGNGMIGSPHDFSGSDWNFRDEICRVCHVPHDHNRNYELFSGGLLWNHQLSSATYQMYAEEGAMNDNFASFIDGAYDNEPTGSAKLCLGCHDGTIGIDQFDRNSGASGSSSGDATVFIGEFDGGGFQVPGADIPMIGSDLNLTGTHPISIVYDEVADSGLHPRTNTMGTSGTIDDVLDQTPSGPKVMCASCHDVHDSVGEAVPGTHLLRVSTKTPASGLCLTCHNK